MAGRTTKTVLDLSFKNKMAGYNVARPFRLKKEDEALLLQHCPFYQGLTAQQKVKFQARMIKFICMKQFQTKAGLKLSNEMVLLISAAAIQLTFGLSDYRFLHFDRIIIYPEKFYSEQLQQFHLGQTHSHGHLSFSWKHLLSGYENAHDNINLGLHEFAHALFLNHVAGKKEDYHFETAFENWKQQGSVDYFELKRNDSPYLRSYAQANFMEFFAVCVECFFETPDQLAYHHPSIHKSLKDLLNLNPSKILANIPVQKTA